MTPYFLEFLVAGFSIVGTVLLLIELWYRRDWFLWWFFVMFLLAPLWFKTAHFRLLVWGDPDWVLNRWISLAVRIPLTVALYVAVWGLRRRRNGKNRPSKVP